LRAIGKIKNAYGSCIPTNSEEKAREVVWLMVILYNWPLRVALGSSLLIFIFLEKNLTEKSQEVIFRTLSTPFSFLLPYKWE